MSIDERERVHRKFQDTFDKIEGHAEFIEGLRYHIYGSEADQDEIFTYYKKAAELSKVPSIQYMVGMFYLKGLGTESSRTLARKWFLLSAENGCADAQYSLWRLNYEIHKDFLLDSCASYDRRRYGCMWRWGNRVR